MSTVNRIIKIKPTKFIDPNMERGRALAALTALRGVERALQGDPLISSIYRHQWRHVIKVVEDAIDRVIPPPGRDNGARLLFETTQSGGQEAESTEDRVLAMGRGDAADESTDPSTEEVDHTLFSVQERIAYEVWMEYCASGEKPDDIP
ncbi:MAG: hypothetical protein LC114_04305, partial [Bryobacterales bacterium]|nr:hypothetical protein [Bryobacterales bacterium]